jgi:hypothetical protein
LKSLGCAALAFYYRVSNWRQEIRWPPFGAWSYPAFFSALRNVKRFFNDSQPTGIAGSRFDEGILRSVDYSVGSRVRVRLYSGKVVEAEITAITKQSTGRKLQIVYGNVTASINPAQITEVLPTT